jgi:transmembrane E3 ubiquitin-protein ligase
MSYLSDAGFTTLLYLMLVLLLNQQMRTSRTPSGMSNLSRWTFFSQAAIDTVAFAAHITFAVLAEGKPSIALVAPAFLACTVFVNEAVRTFTKQYSGSQ